MKKRGKLEEKSAKKKVKKKKNATCDYNSKFSTLLAYFLIFFNHKFYKLYYFIKFL
jgi:hypothetical protein